MSSPTQIDRAYELARERYAELGVDTDRAIDRLARISVSIHCWQGDDVTGFENQRAEWEAAWPLPATTPAKRARLKNCVVISKWQSRSSRDAIVLAYTRAMPNGR
jgi:L-rhamnose isomerase